MDKKEILKILPKNFEKCAEIIREGYNFKEIYQKGYRQGKLLGITEGKQIQKQDELSFLKKIGGTLIIESNNPMRYKALDMINDKIKEQEKNG